jgi:hypothetical protein
MTIPYLDFIARWPAYGLPPYDQATVELRLLEISQLFPQIETCLPEESRVLATGYAFKDLELQEDCDTVVGLVSQSSMNDKVVYQTGKTPFALSSTMWGNRLARMFRTYGCHVSASPQSLDSCC